MKLRNIITAFFIAGAVLFSITGCGKPAGEEKQQVNQPSSVTETPILTETPSVTETPVPTEAPSVTETAVPFDPEEVKSALIGNWYESYHSWYLEIKEDEFILRDGMKETTLITAYSLAEEDGKVRILPEKEGLSYNYSEYGVNSERVFATIPEIFYLEDRIEMKYLSSYLPDENEKYTFERAEKGPFDNITIRDDEFLQELQGKWVETEGSYYVLYFEGNQLKIGNEYENEFVIEDELPIHIISYDWAPKNLYLIHTDLVHTDFYAFTRFEYKDGLLQTNEMVLDADFDTSIDFRKAEN